MAGPSSAVVGLVTDGGAWKHALVVLQQLIDVRTTLPAVVFNTSALPPAASAAISALGSRLISGGSLVSLEPAMEVPDALAEPLKKSHGKLPAWRKLALWSQLQYARIVYLDIDVLLLRNIDHMARFTPEPADVFTPEVCSWPKCVPSAIPAGINVGVMVIAPSAWKFRALQEYATLRASQLAAAADSPDAYGWLSRQIVGSAEQSFLREFYVDVMNVSIVEPVSQRRGWDWDVQTYVEKSACARRQADRLKGSARHNRSTYGNSESCEPGTLHVMSRRYNARPLDCARCPADMDNVIVHYACTTKPWESSRHAWRTLSWCRGPKGNTSSPFCDPCLSRYAEHWFDAEDRMCAALKNAADQRADERPALEQALKARCLRLNGTSHGWLG